MHDPTTVTALAALVIALGYAGHVALWPYRPCPACHGHGRHTHPLNRRAVRPCHACNGHGLQERLATRLWRNHRDRKENR